MTTYAVGDIQGCFSTLLKLLSAVNFDWVNDRLWVCGDIVNRGPQSLNTLRYLYEHRDRVSVVLGNHDLHMLAVAHGAGVGKGKDNFYNIIEEPSNQVLLDWLLEQPLARYHEKRNALMVHAGVPKQWKLRQVLSASSEVQKILSSNDKRTKFFKSMYGNQPDLWSDALTGMDRLRFITNALTRMRFCYPDGRLNMLQKCSPGRGKNGVVPWYELPLKLEKKVQIVFGHWAALNGRLKNGRFQALDTGAVWGNKLTALNLKTQKRTSVAG